MSNINYLIPILALLSTIIAILQKDEKKLTMGAFALIALASIAAVINEVQLYKSYTKNTQLTNSLKEIRDTLIRERNASMQQRCDSVAEEANREYRRVQEAIVKIQKRSNTYIPGSLVEIGRLDFVHDLIINNKDYIDLEKCKFYMKFDPLFMGPGAEHVVKCKCSG
jgi:hypothetical protein